MSLGRDGGYRGIVVNIGEEIPEEECAVLVDNIKVTTMMMMMMMMVMLIMIMERRSLRRSVLSSLKISR